MVTQAELATEAPSGAMEEKPKILVVEDDAHMRALIVDVIGTAEQGFETVSAESSPEAMDYLENHSVAVVVTDIKMPAADGVEVLKFAKEQDPLTQVVMVTGYATVESAIETLKGGAYDYIKKPFDNVELRITVERAYEYYRLSRENERLSEDFRICTDNGGLVGQSQAIQNVRKMIAASAGYDCPVLITGPSGSGKEMVARKVHAQSRRSQQEFVAINCAAIPEHLIESELFGYKKGAFTGAERSKAGLFQMADGGTLFLDEVNNASLSLQAKLLRVLQDGTFYAMGDTEPKQVDVRVLCASNRNIPELIGQGGFREDLYYRLAVLEIHIPPLSERREDIPLLAYHFLNKYSRQLGKSVKGISTDALGALMRYEWPGSVRELENLIQRMLILTETDRIDTEVLPPQLQSGGNKVAAIDHIPPQSLEEIEAFFIRKTLRETKGDRALTAEILGIDKSTLWRKMKRYQIEVRKE